MKKFMNLLILCSFSHLMYGQNIFELKKVETKTNSVEQGKVISGLREGLWIFFKDDRIDKIVNYKCGKLNGSVLFIDSLNNIYKELNFVNGKLNGLSYFFNSQGECIAIFEYINDIKYKVKLYKLDTASPSKDHAYLPYSKDDF